MSIEDAVVIEDLDIDMSLYARLLREKREEVRRGWAVRPTWGTAGVINMQESPTVRPADAEVQLMRFSRGQV